MYQAPAMSNCPEIGDTKVGNSAEFKVICSIVYLTCDRKKKTPATNKVYRWEKWKPKASKTLHV